MWLLVHAEVHREGSRMDIHGTVPYDTGPRIDNAVRRYRMIYANGFTVLYDTGLHSRCPIYSEQHRAASKIEIGFVRYDYERDVRLRNDFFGNP